MKRILAVCLMAFTAPAYAAPKVESETRPMKFEACLALIRATADSLGVAPINIVETSIMRVVRFNTADGSVIVTCSKPDQKMILTKSPHKG